MKHICFVFIVLFLSSAAFSQAIILDPSSSGNALIEGQSTTKGLLPPRMTTVQRLAIQNPERGLIVYDRNVNALFVFNGYDWGKIQMEEGTKIVTDTLQLFNNVAVDNNYMVIGDDNKENGRGAAYIFKLSGSGIWQFDKRIVANDRAISDSFGCSVAISGGRIAVGANRNSNSSGAVYIFELLNGSWIQRNKITASDAANNDIFGSAIGLSGNRLVVGAPWARVNSKNNAGKVYVFNRTSFLGNSVWSQTILPIDPRANDYYGRSVAINNDEIVIGADGEDYYTGNSIAAADVGSVSWYKFLNGNWTLQHKYMFGINTTYINGIGNCVDINDNYIAFGSTQAQNVISGLTYTGIAVIINKQSSEIKVAVNTTAPFEAGIQKPSNFSRTLKLKNDHLLVGAYDFQNNVSQGAYLIKLTDYSSYFGYVPVKKVFSPKIVNGTTFGWAVALTDDQVLFPYFNYTNGNSEIVIEEY
jgi:hypothetical protein